MKLLSSTDIQLMLEHINDYLQLGMKDCKKFKLFNGKIHIPLLAIRLASAEANKQLHLRHIFPSGISLSVSIQNCIVSIPILKLMKFVRDTYQFSNDDFRKSELQKMFSSVPSLKEICANKIYDYLEAGSISKNEVSIFSNFQLDDGLMNLGLFKKNSPTFKMSNKELTKEDDLVDRTPADPYHSWAIVPYSKR